MRTFVWVMAVVGCSRAAPASIARDPAPAVAPVCVGEKVPTDLQKANLPYLEGVALAADGSVAGAVAQSGVAKQYVTGAEGIVVWSADGTVKERYRIDAAAIAFAPSSSDRRLGFTSSNESGILDRDTGCARRWQLRGGLLRFRADGRMVIAGDDRVRAIDAASGAVVSEVAMKEPVALDLAAGTVAVLDGSHGLHLYGGDLSAPRDVASALDDFGNARVVAIAPDGSRVAAGTVEKYAVKYPPGTKPGSPYGHRIFVRLIALPAGSESERFESDVEALAFSPDSSSLAVADERALSIRKLSDKSTRVLDEKVHFARQLAWSADGKRLALADWRGAVRVYDVATGAVRVLDP